MKDGATTPIRVSTLARRIEAAGTARGVITNTNSGPSWSEPRSESVGIVDFAHHRAEWTHRSTNRKGKVRVVTYRQLGSFVYANDPRGAFGSKPVPGKSWTRESFPFDLGGQFADGAGVLRTAAANPYERIIRVGTERVRGVATTHYRLSTTSHVAPKLLALGYPAPGHSEIWVDHQERTRRLAIEASGPTATDHHRTVIEFFDFGVPVSVTAPPAEDVAISHHGFGPYTPTGRWTAVAHGTAGRVTWRVSTIRIKHGECYAIDTVPPEPHGGDRVAGRPTDGCSTGDDGSDPLDLTLRILPDGSQLISGRTNPRTTSLTLHFDDGKTQEVTPRGRAVAFSVTGNRVVTKIVPHIPGDDWSCRMELDIPVLLYNCSGSSGGPPTEPAGGPPSPVPPMSTMPPAPVAP